MKKKARGLFKSFPQRSVTNLKYGTILKYAEFHKGCFYTLSVGRDGVGGQTDTGRKI